MDSPSAAEYPPATERLRLRRLSTDDAHLMLAIWNDADFVRYVTDRGIRTLAEAREVMRDGVLRLYVEYGYGPYAMDLKDGGATIGICGLFRRDDLEDPDIGFALLPAFRRRGYVYEAARSVVSYARDSLGLSRLKAIVAPDNAASVAVIRKLGLEFEKMHRKPGDEGDVAVYGITLRRVQGG
jgi:RimJ/RimL family protein N-acetyltransferase